jgi:Kef-type K+ transport system membrane component KefB
MPEFSFTLISEVSWPIVLCLAWIAGEAGNRWLGLPRISSYGIVGFAMAAKQFGLLPVPSQSSVALLADFALGLCLFELGYRFNLGWLRANPWLLLTSFAESVGTFFIVWLLSRWMGMSAFSALLLSALAMSTSPVALLRAVSDLRAGGQVTERAIHLTTFNCTLAVFVFKALVGYSLLESSGGIPWALWNGLVAVFLSACIGGLFGWLVPMLQRLFGRLTRDTMLVLVMVVLLLTELMRGLMLSPVIGALAFGLMIRQRRVILPRAQQHFDVIGDLVTIFLFVFAAATLNWREVIAGAGIALAIIAARFIVKTAATTAFAYQGGISWRKGFLTGVAMMPFSVFAILLLEQTRTLIPDVPIEVSGFAAMALILEVLGPLASYFALVWAGETAIRKER